MRYVLGQKMNEYILIYRHANKEHHREIKAYNIREAESFGKRFCQIRYYKFISVF